MKIVTSDELDKFLSKLKGWIVVNNRIEKEFELKDFASALTFIIKCGIEAEKMDHHPDMLLHSWNRVKISISTHSIGGITIKDLNFAQQIDKIN